MRATKTDIVPRLQTIATEAIRQADTAREALETFVDTLDEARKVANHLRYKLDIGQPESSLLPYQHKDDLTGAEGVIFPGISDIFYIAEQAAKLAESTPAAVLLQVKAGTVYGVTIGGEMYISENSLLRLMR